MTGTQLLSAYSEIAKNDLFPVSTITDIGVDEDMAMFFINLGTERVMRLLRIEAQDTFAFVSGTPQYGLEAASATRFFELSNVNVGGSDLCRTSMGATSGFYVVDDQLFFNLDYADGTAVILRGYKYGPEIANTSDEITIPHKSCHLAIAQLAIIESCTAHESNPDQLVRLQRLETTAEDACQRRRNSSAMSDFPSNLINGRK